MTILPLVVLLAFPGTAIATAIFQRRLSPIAWVGLAGACGVLWSTIASLLLTALQIPLSLPALTVVGVLPAIVVGIIPWLRERSLRALREIDWDPRQIVVLALTVVVLTVPLATIHHELPTGDVQKAIFWARDIREHSHLPDYAEARRLNRDPADFLTPGLHTLTVAVGVLAGDDLRGSAWFSLAASVALAALAAALTAFVTPDRRAPTIAFLAAALNLRFLRYAFAPGYHYQNLLGELLLLLALVAAFQGLTRGKTSRSAVLLPLALTGLTLAVIPLVHQFTAFLSLFLALGVGIAVLIVYRTPLRAWWQGLPTPRRAWAVGAVAIAAVAAEFALWLSPLKDKLPDLFTKTPHLTGLLIPPLEIPALLGPGLVFFGVAGLLLVWLRHTDWSERFPFTALSAWLVAIAVLSQGPRFFLDIPSARTLFYAAVPLAVFAGVFIAEGARTVHRAFPRAGAGLALLVIATALAPFGRTAAAQLAATTHAPRVNTTLTEETLRVLDDLSRADPDTHAAILIDDWNRRRLTWTILSPYRMLTRVGGDFRVIADEATQSDTRRALFAAHADFEKIFMLGNHPAIRELLDTHSIALIASARGVTDDVFAANVLLGKFSESSETVVYALRDDPPPTRADPETSFLLSPTTLANDVGDTEDVLPHSAISLRATRISEPVQQGAHTSRDIRAASADLRVNVDTYARQLWDVAADGRIVTPLRLLIRAASPGSSITIQAEDTMLGTLPEGATIASHSITIAPGTLTVDDQGFATITLVSTPSPLTVDLIALGSTEGTP